MEQEEDQLKIVTLIISLIRGEIREDEREMLEAWLENPENQQEYKKYLRTYYHLKWTTENGLIHREEAKSRILHGAIKTNRRFYGYGIAASLLLLFTFSIYLYVSHDTLPNTPVAYSFIPDSPHPRLTLSGGDTLQVNYTEPYLLKEEGRVIAHVDEKALIYEMDSTQLPRENRYNTVYIPRGGEFYIRLGDGTEIWLNSETEITYPIHFSDTAREIFFNGEAYFKVSPDKERMFRVISGNHTLQVYGTEFNVNTHDAGQVETVLVNGSVGVSIGVGSRERRLTPHQLAIADRESGNIAVHDVDVQPYIAWKNHDLIFMNERLESIMRRISKWYNVDVVFEDEASKEVRFSANVPKYSELMELLERMGEISNVNFKTNGYEVRISRKQ